MNSRMIIAAQTNVKRTGRPWLSPLKSSPIFLPAYPLQFVQLLPPRVRSCLMIKLDSGNVLLKPSHRRQLMAWLRRAIRLGEKLGNLVVSLTLQRIGKQYEVRASVHHSAGNFDCRRRDRDWRSAMRDVVMTLT